MEERIRLDKWLWAARFFKTRQLAVEAIQGGKVHYKGQRVKPSRTVDIGAEVRITQGEVERVVIVKGLSKQRRPASEARLLYQETEESVRRREEMAEMRRMEAPRPGMRPTKRERRKIVRFKGKNMV
ncbi:MAG: ribosome-associated heat shock protein Hsp15 [Gammaproteobacteria bacterium]|nr:MAG: ribosome-associated heat shock protein Hsp15 [Gammaproteobacteria bacterium]